MTEAIAALEGLRVVSFGNFVAGNGFAMLLAELGADVVKMESHSRPDPVRMRFTDDHPETHEPSGPETTSLFAGLARSVRDLSIDMKHPRATELFRRIALATDVVFENFGAGVLDGWGVGWGVLSELNPELVMVSISGYGRTGPRAGYLAYGGNISSFVGLTELWGQSHGALYDYVAGSHAVAAVLAALRRRDATGEGCYIDAGQIDGAAAMLGSLMLDQLNDGPDLESAGNSSPTSLLTVVAPCTGDDEWVAVDIETADQLLALGSLLDLRQEAGEAMPLVEAALMPWARSRTSWQAALALQAAGVPAAPVQSSEAVWRDPQLRARHSLVAIDHPDLGRIEYPAPVHRMTLTPARIRAHAPRLGHDTRYVLSEWLHLDDAEIAELVDQGVVATDAPHRDTVPAAGRP